MTYVTIREDSETRLHLCREPSIKAWAILVALISFGFGAAYYSADYIIWKLAYISGAVFVGLTCMEDWEECILDKEEKSVMIKRNSLIQKLFQATRGQKIVVDELENIVSVRVQEEEIKYGTMGYIVVLIMAGGYSLGVTEVATTDDKSLHEQVSAKICRFLQIADKEEEENIAAPDTPNGDDNSSTTSDEGFEHVDKTDLIDEEEIPEDPPKKEDTMEGNREESEA